MTPELYERAVNLRLVASRLVEAAEAGDDELYRNYAMEAELAGTEVANMAEAAQVVQSLDDREGQARKMLDDYHIARTNLAIRKSIHDRLIGKGNTHATVQAYELMAQAERVTEAAAMTIMELMGVWS